jgi:H+-transporting ATPase
MKFQGLSSEQAQINLKEYGPNIITEKTESYFLKITKQLFSPISLMLFVASFLSYVSGKQFDFYFILILLFINVFITIWHEMKADNAVKKIREHLFIKINVLRGGKWQEINSVSLVPGDIVELVGGNIIPADLKILEAENLTLNEAALTGESMPQERRKGEVVFSGAYVITGEAKAEVAKTGENTYLGKIIYSISDNKKKSILEKDILGISKFLSIFSLAAVLFLTSVLLYYKLPLLDIITLDLSLIIAGIPISLPTVMTLIISFGVVDLTKKDVIVRRLSSLEDLANVDVLFTDKTGTLTKNEIAVVGVVGYGLSKEEILFYAYLSSIKNDISSINKAIIEEFNKEKKSVKDFEILEFLPADAVRKRSFVVVKIDKKNIAISVGAPQVIANLSILNDGVRAKYENDIKEAADRGYRVVAVAINRKEAKENNMNLIGIIMLSDKLRGDSRDAIDFLKENGVRVKMLTGDHKAIAENVAEVVGINKEDVYYQILPSDKLEMVKSSQLHHIVAVTGDGINDLPAIKASNVGIAVSNSVDALKSSADIVLLSDGIAVVKDAIIDARGIFHRLYTYSVYRISESIRLIATIAILGFLYHNYPLTPIQIILLALLNDLPIISLAFNRVKIAKKPSKINARKRFILSSFYGLVGVTNSLLLFFILIEFFHFDLILMQSIFFLKFAISGHMLIYVVHTEERWYKFLPSKKVILTTFGTQIIATLIVLYGLFMNSLSIYWIIFVWIWAIFWMQISELVKVLKKNLLAGYH